MKRRATSRALWCMSATVVFACMTTSAASTPFPAQGDETTPSMGMFRLKVRPEFNALFDWLPAAGGALDAQGNPLGFGIFTPDAYLRVNSPTLNDAATVIGVSAPHQHGDATDLDPGGVAVGGTIPAGRTPTKVSDADALNPPPGWQGPDDTWEFHTEVRSFNMVDTATGMYLKAGIARLDPLWDASQATPATDALGHPLLSPGEVQSLGSSADFPAESFFNVYVEVGIPGITDVPLYVDYPLLVVNENINDSPPEVVYLHGGSPKPVGLRFEEAGTAFGVTWKADDLLGWVSLAGHNVAANPTEATLYKALEKQVEIVIVPEPITTALVGALGLLGVAAYRRRKSVR